LQNPDVLIKDVFSSKRNKKVASYKKNCRATNYSFKLFFTTKTKYLHHHVTCIINKP